ncbi:MAG TPA: single-stranded DNA-binding protein [Pseudolysinimonas sp.]|jgi:single-strand DNA-binding protein|nr:single-stranded DNA-binding protein [Pseudolysinimonas sp.]
MSDTLTLTGLVATTPKHLVTSAGLSITSFRLASNQRRYDRAKQEWVDVDTNWYTITAFRQLANNVVHSLHKGQRIVVTGRVRIRDWNNEEKKTSGTTIEVDAEAIGHDLTWGTSVFTRSAAAAVAADAAEQGQGVAGEGDAPASAADEASTDAVAVAEASYEPQTAGIATPF